MTLKELFFEVADLPDEAAQRERLRQLGASDAQQAQVLDLCARERRRAGTRFSQPVAAALAHFSANELQTGDLLGPWRLGEPLGAGGMGRVFRAERADGLYQQRAALKLLRGAAPPELLARERQILATLDHPHIARLLDGGTTPLGRPYFVMAHVEGRPLDAWAAQATLAQRIAVIHQIASALDHAHRHLVVHCDLKPDNVLVSDAGHAVLLDFGIARLEQDLSQAADGPQALTPHYASPEQLRGEPLTSSTDVHGLGRLVELLLAGAPREREWRAIVAKACAAQPAQRYASALALVDDLSRWQTQRPVQALPATPGYRIAKALRRQWPFWLGGSLLLAMAAAFTWQLALSRDRARLEARSAQQTADFVVGLFQGANAMDGGRPDLPVSELLDRGRERMARELAAQPELLGRMQGVLARVYRGIGRPRDALALAEQAAAAPHADTLAQAHALSELARVQAVALGLEQALATARKALALREQQAQRDPLALGDSHHQMLLLLADARQFAEAEQHGRIALATLQRHAPEDQDRRATLENNLGRLQLFAGHPAQAEPHLRRALALREQLDGALHGRTLTIATNLAAVLHDLQRLPEAEAMLRRLLEQRRQVHGAQSQHVMETQRELAYVLLDADRPEEAVALMRDALAALEKIAAPGSSTVAASLRALAEMEAAAGQVASAEARFADTAARAAGDALSLRNKARLRTAWARLLLDAGRADAALAVLEPLRAPMREKSRPGEVDRVEFELLHAELALLRGDPQPGRALLEALDAEPPVAGAQRRPERTEALVLRLRGLLAEGAARARYFDEAWTRGSLVLGPGDPRLRPLRLSQVESLLASGRRAEAEPLLAVLRRQTERLPAGHALRARVEALR